MSARMVAKGTAFAGLTELEEAEFSRRRTLEDVRAGEEAYARDHVGASQPFLIAAGLTPEHKEMRHNYIYTTKASMFDYHDSLVDIVTFNDRDVESSDDDEEQSKSLSQKDDGGEGTEESADTDKTAAILMEGERFDEDELPTQQRSAPGAITQGSNLVALLDLKARKLEPHLQLVKNMSGIAHTAYIRCYIELPDSTVLPPPTSVIFDPLGPNLKVTFGKLGYAPIIRLRLSFHDNNGVGKDSKLPYFIGDIDFHWANDSRHKRRGVQDFAISKGSKVPGCVETMTFDSGYATSAGFNPAYHNADIQKRMGSAGRALVDRVVDLFEPGKMQKIVLHLVDNRPKPKKADNSKAFECVDPYKENSEEAFDPLRLTHDPQNIQMRAHMPGGSEYGEGYLLESFRQLEYSQYRSDAGPIYIAAKNMYKPLIRMNSAVPHPMALMLVEDTFASPEEAAIQFAQSVDIAQQSKHLQLKHFEAVQHNGLIYKNKDIVVVGLRFRSFQRLATHNDESTFRLPEWAQVDLSYLSRNAKTKKKLRGFILSVPLSDIPPADVHIAVTNRISMELGNDVVSPDQEQYRRPFRMKVKVHDPETRYHANMATAARLLHRDTERWHRFIMNQFHGKTHELTDIYKAHIKNLPESEQAAAHEAADAAIARLMDYKPWNTEQREALASAAKALYGICIICGIAGTGKTTLLVALMQYFADIGLHVVFAAPTNANVDNVAALLSTTTRVSFCRLFAGSMDWKRDQMVTGDRGPQDYDDEPLEFVLLANEINTSLSSKIGDDARNFGFQAQMTRDARSGVHKGKLFEPYQGRNGKFIRNGDEQEYDMWSELHRFIFKMERNEYDRDDELEKRLFGHCYAACFQFLVRECRTLLTTTGNFRSPAIMHQFARNVAGMRITKGIVLFIDEAAKDTEINILNGLLNEAFGDDVLGVFMFADEAQLSPPNLNTAGRLECNEFVKRTDISIVSRLSRQGFPTITRLVQQSRMAEVLARFPSKEFYSGTIKTNNSITDHKLDSVANGLNRALTNFLTSMGRPEPTSEDQLRLQYVVLQGKRLENEHTKSKVVLEHARFFCDNLWELLHDVFGAEMSKKVYVIVAYRETKNWWLRELLRILKGNDLTIAHVPTVVTVDTVQGDEAPVTIVDLAIQRVNCLADVGFVANYGRFNVSITRAKEVLIMLGGSCDGPYLVSRSNRLGPIPVRYFKYCADNGFVTTADNDEIPPADYPPQLMNSTDRAAYYAHFDVEVDGEVPANAN